MLTTRPTKKKTASAVSAYAALLGAMPNARATTIKTAVMMLEARSHDDRRPFGP